MHVLKVQGLSKTYRLPFGSSKKALHNISLELKGGGATGLLGVNGSGKSTFIKCILNLIYPDSGEVLFFNSPLSSKNKKLISYLPEKPQFYDYLTGEEFLRFTISFGTNLSRREVDQEVDQYLELVQLQDAKKHRLREYSKGMYQRIGLAQSISRDAQFIILDEPMSDLDPSGRLLIKKILKNILNEKKVSILLCSHLLQDIEDLCSQLVILNEGKTLYSGSSLDFIQKIEPMYEIYYTSDSEDHVVQASAEDLQDQIDSLRRQNFLIFKIKNLRNLEEAFRSFLELEL